MNKPPARNAPAADDANRGAVVFSKNHTFIVTAQLADPRLLAAGATAGPDPEKKGDPNFIYVAPSPSPTVGVDQYIIRFVYAQNFAAVSKNAAVAATFSHVGAEIAGDYPAAVQAQADGSFVVNAQIKKHGDWLIHLQLSDTDPKTGETVSDTADVPLHM